MTARGIDSLPEQDQPTGLGSDSKRRNRLPYQRITLACSHCRRRKIRCIPHTDTTETRCQNCIKLKKDCIYQPVPGSGSEPSQSRSNSRPDISDSEISSLPGLKRRASRTPIDGTASAEFGNQTWATQNFTQSRSRDANGPPVIDTTWTAQQQAVYANQSRTSPSAREAWPADSGLTMQSPPMIQTSPTQYMMASPVSYQPHYAHHMAPTAETGYGHPQATYAVQHPAPYYGTPYTQNPALYGYPPTGMYPQQHPGYGAIYQPVVTSSDGSAPGYLASQRVWPPEDPHNQGYK